MSTTSHVTSVWLIPWPLQSGGNPGQASSVQVRGKNNHASSMFFPFLFFFFPNGNGRNFFPLFRFPVRENLSQTFRRDSPLGRHQTWMFSTREQKIWDFQASKEEIWGNSSRSGPLRDFPCLWGVRQRAILCFSPRGERAVTSSSGSWGQNKQVFLSVKMVWTPRPYTRGKES